MSDRPYDEYRSRRHDLREVRLTLDEIWLLRGAMAKDVENRPNPPRNGWDMAAYSALEELSKAGRKR